MPNQQKPGKAQGVSFSTSLSAGVGLGAGIGLLFDNLVMGISIGMILGIAVSAFGQFAKPERSDEGCEDGRAQ